MAKKYPLSKELFRLFKEALESYPGFSIIESGIVSHIKIDSAEFFVYFKCICHEGNPYPLEHQRAQLPQRPEFEEIKKTSIPFLFLGYDVDHDVYACWEPDKVKMRLNKRTYVSFYSRLSLQESVKKGKIEKFTLTNGDQFILFKREDMLTFLKNIKQYFQKLNPNTPVLPDILNDVNLDPKLKKFIDNFPDKDRFLDLLSACTNKYEDKYPKMTLKDWTNLLKGYLND